MINSPTTPRNTPPAPTVPAAGRTSQEGPLPAQNKGMYGVAEYRNGFGCRFVGHDLTEAQAAALCATARAVGCRPANTNHFLTESTPQ